MSAPADSSKRSAPDQGPPDTHVAPSQATTAPRSARGLFNAMGKTAKPVAVRAGDDLAGAYEVAEHMPREKHGFYPTPPDPTLALVAHERHRLTRFPHIWEPACGDGAMARDLRSCGLTVVESDLVERHRAGENGARPTPVIRDFFAFGPRSRLAPAIVTNPPFELVNWAHGRGRWIRHALEVCRVDYMALFLPANVFFASGMGALWADHPPTRIYDICWRIDFTGQGASPTSNCWFVWDPKARMPGTPPAHLRIEKGDALKALEQGVLV